MPSITCAHCKKTHGSVAEVRACATGHSDPCCCGVYDRCAQRRMLDGQAAAHLGVNAMIRAQHRAYND